jgi:hypothetical protein
MVSGRQKYIKAVALLLVFSLIQLYVHLSLAGGPEEAVNKTQAQQNFSKLWTYRNKSILVNGNKAETGATILDGALLETSDCVTARVYIGTTDEVELATNTTATINYSDGKLKVTLKKGCIIERAASLTNATVDTPDGKSTSPTEPDSFKNRKRVEVCFPDGVKSDFTPSCGPTPFLIWGSVIGGVTATVAALALGGSRGTSTTTCVRGEDTSLISPTDPCQ